MIHRTPLRIFLLTLGALALGVVGAALLGRGSAGAALSAEPAPSLGVTVSGNSVTVGPVTAALPVPLPVAEPVRVAVPLPPVVAPVVAGLPVVGEVATTLIDVGIGPVTLPLPVDLLSPITRPLGASTGADVVGPAGAVPFAALDAARIGTSVDRLPTLASAIISATESTLVGISSGTPALPAIPWTLAFSGLAVALASAGANRAGDRRGNDSPFVAVVTSLRRTRTRLLAVLGPRRPDPSRPGFALLLARPG